MEEEEEEGSCLTSSFLLLCFFFYYYQLDNIIIFLYISYNYIINIINTSKIDKRSNKLMH